jgi:hypothetical protein
VAIVALTAALIWFGATNTYFIRQDSHGTALWNSEGATFFVWEGSSGHKVRHWRLPWFILKEILGAVEDADDYESSLTVIHVTPLGVVSHALKLPDGSGPGSYTPFEGRIYASFPYLCWWAGDHFEAATEEEKRRLNDVYSLTRNDYDGHDGWSRRSFVAAPPGHEFSIDVGAKFQILVKDVAEDGTKSAYVSIDLLRPGRPSERVATFRARTGRISGAEYKRMFGQ